MIQSTNVIKAAIAIVLAAVMLIPVAAADDGGGASYGYFLKNVPEIYLQGSGAVSVNLTFPGMVLVQNNVVYFAPFNSVKWTITHGSNGSYAYSGSPVFTQVRDEYLREQLLNFLGMSEVEIENPQSVQGDIQTSVTIYFNLTSVPAIVGVNNTTHTGQMGAFKITFVLESSSINGKGTIGLIQFLAARINNLHPNFSEFNESEREKERHAILLAESRLTASYWWSDNYTLNGVNQSLAYVVRDVGYQKMILFRYNFTNGVSSIVQDPYLASPQFDFLHSPLNLKEVRTLEIYFIDHVKIAVAGGIAGAALVGIAYGSYRSRTRLLKKRYKVVRKR
ncbi:hypothetical protein ApAK_07705 [Thermoplasmatales archaeon AK]|nr:hypothetical protein [Thermoplasmatales archaeon AK]